MGAKQRKPRNHRRTSTRGSQKLYDAAALLHNGTITGGSAVVQSGGHATRPIPTPRIVGRKHPRSWTK
jgi:hypothetical protein